MKMGDVAILQGTAALPNTLQLHHPLEKALHFPDLSIEKLREGAKKRADYVHLRDLPETTAADQSNRTLQNFSLSG